jgi:hypothetical protein
MNATTIEGDNHTMRTVITAAIAAALIGAAPPPIASALPATCVEQFWLVGLRAATRFICDGPIEANGGWMRARAFYAPAYVAAGYSSCYGYGYCTFTPPRYLPKMDVRTAYWVTPETVLADEPGHVA